MRLNCWQSHSLYVHWEKNLCRVDSLSEALACPKMTALISVNLTRCHALWVNLCSKGVFASSWRPRLNKSVFISGQSRHEKWYCVHDVVSVILCLWCVRDTVSVMLCPWYCVRDVVSVILFPWCCVRDVVSLLLCPCCCVHNVVLTVH